MHFRFNQKILASILIGATLAIATGCSDKSEAQTQPVKDAPKSVSINEGLSVPSGTYGLDKTHGYVTFSYTHKGLSNPQLRFDDVNATIELDAQNPEKSKVSATISAASINSGVAKFDDHLNSPDFFNTKDNPQISFTSTSFTRTTATSGTMTGDMSLMGITKPISFDVVLIGTKDGSKPAIGVEGRTTLMRSDWNLGKYVPNVSDKVSIVISAEFYKE